MTISDSSDARDRWTLRFVDPDLERAYQRDDREEGVRRARTASLVAASVWVVVALIGPPTIGVPSGPTVVVCGVMTAFLVACAVVSRWATTPVRRDAIGIGQQLVATGGVLVLTSITGSFDVYAMPGMMLTAVFGFSVTRPPLVGSIGLAIAYCGLFVAAAAANGVWAQLPLQAAVLLATVVSASVGAYLLERSQREAWVQRRVIAALHARVDRLLHQYLSPDVATNLIEDPDRAALGGEEVELTVLFADLRGYTAYAEGRPPTEVVAMLNDAFGIVVPIVLGEGGAVVQFMGDALMAIFNAPTRLPDHALRAARAGLAMQRAMAAIPTADGRPWFRVGISTGPALVGNIGAAEIRNFSAIGDTTNLAARLQTFAREGSVVIAGPTYERIRDLAVVSALGSPELKGKSLPVEAYELVALRSA